MATFIGGGELELNMFTAGEPHPSMLNFLRQQTQQLGQYIQQTGNTFAQNAYNAYETYYSDGALRNARVALSKVKSYFREDTIRELASVYDIQQAGLVMQRYLMSQPDLRELYNAGRCNGYNGTYYDPSPGMIGERDYNYRRAVNGLMQLTEPTEEDPDGNWKFEIFSEELHEGDRELDLHEQIAISNTWDRIKYSLAHSLLDPSSPSGDML